MIHISTFVREIYCLNFLAFPKAVANCHVIFFTTTTNKNINFFQPNKRLSKKLPKNCEAANILVGQVDFLTDVVMAFCRLETPSVMADLTEVAIPTRFVFVILGPKAAPDNAIWEHSEIGRAMAALLNDRVMNHTISYHFYCSFKCSLGSLLQRRLCSY
jgi:hypothetical protein